MADAGADPDAPGYIAAVSRLFTQVAERTAPYRRMRQEAAATDREIADDWDTTQAERKQTMAAVAADLPRRGLRPGLAPTACTDTVWALASTEMYDLLTGLGGYSPAEFEAWLARTLTAALCRP